MLHRLRRFFCWIAAFAILGGSMTPAFARLVDAQGFMEICTAKGILKVPAQGDAPDQSHGLHVDHCPFCNLHTDNLALPPADVALFDVPQQRASTFPDRYFTAQRPLFIWASAAARAPPSFL